MNTMREEIAEGPSVVARLLSAMPGLDEAVAAFQARAPRWGGIVARGTSDHAAVYGRYLIETHLGVPTGLIAPSVTSVYKAELAWSGGIVIAVSQSGESPDVVVVVETARRAGALTVAVTNEESSPLALAAEHVLLCGAGPERSIAATKTYLAELTVLAALVGALAPRSDLAAALPSLGPSLAQSLEASEQWLRAVPVVDSFARDPRAIIVSRGYNLATALEVALKMKETSRIFAEAYSSADLEHGPMVLVDAQTPMLVFEPPGVIGASIAPTVARARRRGSRPWTVGTRLMSRSERTLALPIDLPDPLTPLAFVLPGQLLAEAVARRKGMSPEQPHGLTKITRTR